MARALIFGLLASSGLVLGALVSAFWKPPEKLLASALAFASRALMAALAVELFGEAFNRGGAVRAGAGLLGGAGVFVALGTVLDIVAESRRQRCKVRPGPARSHVIGR